MKKRIEGTTGRRLFYCVAIDRSGVLTPMIC